MIKINSALITHILGPIGGTADYDSGWDKFKNVDGSNEKEVKKIISDEIKPFFESANSGYKIDLKNTFAYYLTTCSLDFEDQYEGCLIAFAPPSDARDFFIWIWEVLFPLDRIEIDPLETYENRYEINPVWN